MERNVGYHGRILLVAAHNKRGSRFVLSSSLPLSPTAHHQGDHHCLDYPSQLGSVRHIYTSADGFFPLPFASTRLIYYSPRPSPVVLSLRHRDFRRARGAYVFRRPNRFLTGFVNTPAVFQQHFADVAHHLGFDLNSPICILKRNLLRKIGPSPTHRFSSPVSVRESICHALSRTDFQSRRACIRE